MGSDGYINGRNPFGTTTGTMYSMLSMCVETKNFGDVFQAVSKVAISGAILGIGKSILDTAGKFEKYGAVLKNALGSQSLAAQSMREIEEFASETVFSVDELTDSYVKLANRGFKPTMDEMMKLGDIAASQGKSFDQLTEAILDAQTEEMERLKEFGASSHDRRESVLRLRSRE